MEESTYKVKDWQPLVRQTVADKVRGAVIGSALGDTIGLYTEFLNKSMVKDAYPDGKFTLSGKVTQFCADSHRNKFTEGSWTDDTDHALLIILSYLHSDGQVLSSSDFATRLRIWIEQGLLCLDRLPLGLGRTMGSVVLSKQFLENHKAAAYRNWANSSFTAAPNGSLMRTHPLGVLCLDKSLNETFDVATDFSLITHADPRCVVSCCIVTAVVRAMLRGELTTEQDIDTLVDQAAEYVERYTDQPQYKDQNNDSNIVDPTKFPPSFERDELYLHTKAESYEALQVDDLRKLGYVYKCLGSSIFCLRLAMRRCYALRQANTTIIPCRHIFEDLITELTLEGGDADTNCTVAGALIGCWLGFSMLPTHWYEGMKDIDWLLRKTDAFIQVAGVDECAIGYKGSEDPDTKEDGGRGIFNRQELEAREKAFMEVYLTKTLNKKGTTSTPQSGGAAQGLMKKWKGVFG